MSAEPQHIDVFVSGEDGVCEYRIPALVVTNAGTLIAVCDARVDRPGDAPNNIDLVMKRSFDGGKTWTQMQLIRRYPEDEAACDPCMLMDRNTDTIWVFYDYAVPAPDHPEGRILKLHAMKSEDEGETWCEPVDLAAQLKDPTWLAIYAGPGMGIQMRNGRLVAPVYTRRLDSQESSCHVVYSDDHGETWQIGAGVGSKHNEHQVVELAGGLLMSVIRQSPDKGHRLIAISNDGGETWSDTWEEPALIEPGCQASFIRYTHQQTGHSTNRLLFANPAATKARVNGTVRVSYDEGKTWPVTKTVWEGSFAYSCLTVLPDNTIGLLYERDDYGKVTFARFSLEWLTDDRDHLQR